MRRFTQEFLNQDFICAPCIGGVSNGAHPSADCRSVSTSSWHFPRLSIALGWISLSNNRILMLTRRVVLAS
jgi:hypothetical protein